MVRTASAEKMLVRIDAEALRKTMPRDRLRRGMYVRQRGKSLPLDLPES